VTAYFKYRMVVKSVSFSDILWRRGIVLNWRILIFGPAMCLPQNVYAADAIYNEPNVGLRTARPSFALQITPYIWATGLKGAVSPFGPGPTVGVDRSFSDGRDGLNVAGFVNIWGRYERFVFSANVMYTDTTDSDTYRFPGTSQMPAINLAGGIDTKQFMGTLHVGIASSEFRASRLTH